MKKFLLFVLASSLYFSCGKDDASGSCTNSDFIGTYAGDSACDGDPSSAEEVTILEKSGKLYFVDSDGEEYPMTVNGCKFTIPVIDVIFASVSGSGTLNGKELSSSFTISAFGQSSACTFKGTKK